VIRSQGLYELLHSQALVNQEHARSLATENKTAAIKARYDRRQVAEDYATQKKLERDARVAKYTAMKEARKNATVVVDQFDAVSGQVFWPAALKSRPFENSRREIDALMAERMMMSDGVEADENLRLIRTAATKMWKELSDSSESLLPGQLTTGRGFLKNLIAQASVAHSPRANFVASR
jgi:hypothetical protein